MAEVAVQAALRLTEQLQGKRIEEVHFEDQDVIVLVLVGDDTVRDTVRITAHAHVDYNHEECETSLFVTTRMVTTFDLAAEVREKEEKGS